MKTLTSGEIVDLLSETGDQVFVTQATELIEKWLARGDGCAVYENADLGHPQLGHKKFVSFGSPQAQIETPEPPERLPDIGGDINWRYVLKGVYR